MPYLMFEFCQIQFNINFKNIQIIFFADTNFLNESPFESCYDVEKIIGSGGFAVVYSGTRKSNNKQVLNIIFIKFSFKLLFYDLFLVY